jgi:DNA adenine methylase
MKARNLQKNLGRPFLKWVGGKRSLMPEILARMPDGEIDLYIEPFLGGGAAFLELARQGRIRKAILNDRNPELVHTWRMVRDEPEALIKAVRQWEPTEETYYAVRAIEADTLSDVDRAARVLWLNRTCYNGLYRINRSGRFNVPFGRYKRVQLVDEDNLRVVSETLQSVTLYDIDFAGVMAMAGEGTVVYCDPPYWPLSDTSYFTAYDGQPFKTDDQQRLAECFAGLTDQGAQGILSNSWSENTVELYESHGLHHSQVMCRRNINSNAAKRGPVPEIMVTTFEWSPSVEQPAAAGAR